MEENYIGQPINIDSSDDTGCAYVGGVLHQILHTFGFVHEHQRPDRDTYVTFNEDNVDLGTYSLSLDNLPLVQQAAPRIASTSFDPSQGLHDDTFPFLRS